MGSEQSTRIEKISLNPPKTLEEATSLYLSFYGDSIEKMDFIQHKPTRQFYCKSASDNNSHPGHEMACDLSNIGHLMAHSGVKFTDKNRCGVIHPNATTACNGTSSSGKTQAMTAANARVSAVSSKIIADHVALPDQDGDVEMTPYVSIADLNTDKEEKFDVSYSRRAYHDYVFDFKNNNNAMTKNTLWDSNCDRLKAFYLRIMKKHGHARFVIYELSDKINSLKEAGDESAAQFFIQASDKVIPGRGYSTAKCSTPELSGAACSILCGTTPETIHDFIATYGVKGVARRISTWFFPIKVVDPYDTIAFDEDDELKNQFDDNAVDEALESHRLHKLYQFIYYKSDEDKISESSTDTLYRKQIPWISVGLKSEIIKFKAQYRRDTNNTDRHFLNIKYPDGWTDANGQILIEKMTQNDWYERIRMQMVFHLSDNNTDLNELLRILINTRPVRWAKWAMCLTARKHMMDTVKSREDSLVWAPFILDSKCCEDALKLVDMNDSYLFLLAVTKHGSNKTTLTSTPSNDLAALKSEFKTFIVGKLLSLTSAASNYTTSSSVLTTKLYQARFKPLNNLVTIQALMDDLNDAGLVSLADPEDKKSQK
eukprot:180607_1